MTVVSGRRPSACSLHRRLVVILAASACCWSACLACPKPCACYTPTEIHCTFRYLNAIPENIQAQAERVNLGYNNLMRLTRDSFTGLKSLELLMLHSNKIQEIPDKTFEDLESLQVLKMSYNKVKILNRDTFRGLRNIMRLHLDHNNIEFINPEAFYGLTSLKLLHLEGNVLQELHRDTFVTFRFSQIFKVSSIKHLYLSDNALTSISSDLLSFITEIESIYLHGNKWFCDCELKWLAELNERLPGVIKCKRDRSEPNVLLCPLCANPSVSKGKNILQLPSSVFTCSPPKIQSPLKLRNSVKEEEGDYAIVHAEDFVAPLGQMTLNMSDPSGNGCEITCHVHRPLRSPGVALHQKEGHVLLNTRLSTFLVCYVDYEKIQRIWGILAMYTDSPLRLEREALLSRAPSMTYLYKQPPNTDRHLFTGVRAEITADLAWLLQSEITLQMDRTRTTLNVLQIKYIVDVQATLQDFSVKPGKNSWVMIKRGNSVKTEHFVTMGGTVVLDCQATGDPKPINEWILPDGTKIRAPYSSEDSRISVSANGKFSLRLADLYDTGIYHCIGTNYQDADVLSFRVNILDPNVSEKDINGPYISKSRGDSIHLPCQSSGIPNGSVRWVLPDHRVLDHTASNKEITPNGTLKIKNLTVRDGGFYRCVASNRYGIDLLALQVIVTGSQKESAEADDAVEDGLGSGESEEQEGLESKGMGMQRGQFFTEKMPVHPSTLESWTQLTTGPTVATPRRRMGSSRFRTRWRPNRRTLKQPRGRVDPQRWAEYLEKARRNILAQTSTKVITAKPQEASQPPLDEWESSGDEPRREEEEFIMVTTLRPRKVSISRVSPVLRTEPPHAHEPLEGIQSPIQVHPIESEAKDTIDPIERWPSGQGERPLVIDHTYERKPDGVKAQTATSQQRGAEVELPSSPYFLPTPTPTILATSAPEEMMIRSEEPASRDEDMINISHPSPITTREDGDQVPFDPIQKLTTPWPFSISTIHTARTFATDASVSKPKQVGRRRKFPNRRRLGRPGSRRHRYSIVRPGHRRWVGSLRTPSHRSSSVTKAPERLLLPLPIPTLTGDGLTRVESEVELGRVPVRQGVPVPEMTPTHSEGGGHPMTNPDSQARSPASTIITQHHETNAITIPTPSTLIIKRPTERPSQMSSSSSNTLPTAQPTSKPHKVTHGKIPWHRLFGVNSQKDVLKRLRKPAQGNSTRSVTLPKPTFHSMRTPAPTTAPMRLLFSTVRSQGTSARTTMRFPVTFTSEITTTVLPTTDTAQTITTAAQKTLTARRKFFRRRRPGNPFSRTRSRVLPSRPSAGRNRSAEKKKARPTKTRISFPPLIPVTPQPSSPVTVETSARSPSTEWKPYPKTAEPSLALSATQHGSKSIALTSKPIATSPITLPSPTGNAAWVITTTDPPTFAGTRQRVRNRARPVQTTALPALRIPSVSTTIAPMTEPSVRPSTVLATSTGSLSTLEQTSRANSRFRVTLHRFDTSAPRKLPPPYFRVDRRIFGTIQTITRQSSTEAPIQYRVTTLMSNAELENTIEGEDSRENLSSEFDPSPDSINALGPMVGNWPSKPRIIAGTAASFTVLADSDAVVLCEATGNPLPSIRWTKISTGATITPNARRGHKFEVFANGTLFIKKIKVQDRGQYLCTAENQHGADRRLVTLSVVAHPSKILEPRLKDIIVHSGYPVEMKCRAQGRPSPTISWILSNRTMVRNGSPFNGRVSVLADGTLRIKAVTVYDRGNYRCVASNAAGIDTVTVRMQVLAQPPIILEEKRLSFRVQEGENIMLPCTAEGTPQPTVRWLIFDGTEIKPLQFVNVKLFVFTNGTLYLKTVTPSDSGNYECVATSSSGSEKRVVSLMVERKQESPRIVAASPSKDKLNYGDKLRLHCSATGNPKPHILWRLPSKLLVDPWQRRGGRVMVLFNGTLSINSITEKDAGVYTCTARNKVGDDFMSVKIDVSMKPALIEHKQSIHKHVLYGGDLQVDCKASGAPKPEISWSLPDGTMVNNVLQADDSGRRTRRYVVFGNGTLYYNKVGMAEEGDYTCYARNTLGRDEMKVRVTVGAAAPRIQSSPKARHGARVGESARLDCPAVGSPWPKISWLLPSNEVISSSRSRFHLHPNGTLVIEGVGVADGGEYLCIARNPGGGDSALFHLHVALSPPVINGQRAARTVVEDTAARHSRKLMECSAEGQPRPRISWLTPGNLLLPAPYYGSRIVVHPNGTLEIRHVRPSDQADFTCLARNAVAEAALVVRLAVTPMLRRPVFRNPFNQRLLAGTQGTATLNCSAEGHPPPEILWTLPNGTRLSSSPPDPRYQVTGHGTLLIRRPAAADAGRYRCAARNQVGYIEKLVVLAVAQKPVFHRRPPGLVRGMSGEALTLPCSARGSPLPRIAWTLPAGRVLDRPRIGAKYVLFENGSLLIREVSAEDRGNYICRAQNQAGASSLLIPVVVVAYPPRITNGPAKSTRARVGSPVHLHCMAIGIPKPEIAWELPDHSELSTLSEALPAGSREYVHPQGTLVIQEVSGRHAGAYKCTARSLLGSDSRTTFVHLL
ncbi:immunoglobulin superfamily member 10 [Narcine bancroftii]|uniref:immunoglobulin superfamily member 10 n=1 Tax=Narcine bancroftii TaxID=1343680 RepID=UPI0038320A73